MEHNNTETMSIEAIATTLRQAREAYYDSPEPLMSDAEFDSLEDRLRALDPENDYFAEVGINTAGGNAVHEIPMLSMGKAKSMPELARWIEWLALPAKTPFCVQPKIDGLSASCRYEHGRLTRVATRGDGKSGQDVSYLADYLRDIPRTCGIRGERVEIRGELYLPRDGGFDTGGKPLRNACVGLVNRKDRRDDLRHVRFIAYQILGAGGFQRESEKISFLQTEGFHTVDFIVTDNTAQIDKYFEQYLNTLRGTWPYETDGLIVTVDECPLHDEIDARKVVDHHHHYSIALKPPAEARRTRLAGIEWQVSRQGSVIPVALFEPIVIGGATLSRASLHNHETVQKLHLQPGDELLIERANDVIPYVRENLSPAAGLFADSSLVPATCPSCNTALTTEGVHLKCPNQECPEQRVQQILFWVRECGIEQVAEATIRTLFDAGRIATPRDLYRLDAQDFAGLSGFADKKISNFLSEVNATRSMGARQFIARLGIPMVQERTLKKLNIDSIADFVAFADATYAAGRSIIEWKKDSTNRALLESLLEALDIRDESGATARESVCMTGKGPLPRKELQARIEAMGYEFHDSITANTTILVCEDPAGSSSKLAKARKNGTRIVSYGEFFGSL